MGPGDGVEGCQKGAFQGVVQSEAVGLVAFGAGLALACCVGLAEFLGLVFLVLLVVV